MKKYYKIIITFSIIALFLVVFISIPENRKEFKTLHFTLLYSSNLDSLNIVELSKVLEANYSKISNDLNTIPPKNIEVNIYSQRWRYIKSTGNWFASGSIEGVSKLHFIEDTWLESEISKIAIREFTHAIFLKLLIDREPEPLDIDKFNKQFSKLPVWIWEAVSVYEAEQFYDPKTLDYFSNGKYPDISELNNRSMGQKIYTCGYTIIEFILHEYGHNKLIKLIESYGNIKKVLDITEDQFSKNWHNFIEEKYLK